MSQMMTRKSAVSDEKEKRQTDSPVKDMKKKMAANAEKEKQAAEKSAEKSSEKPEKNSEKADKPKQSEKVEKPKTADKAEKSDKTDKKQPEKSDKSEKKHPEKSEKSEKKQTEKLDKSLEKKVDSKSSAVADSKKTDNKDGKETQDKKDDKDKTAKPEEKKADKSKATNGCKHNGVEPNGVDSASSESVDEDFPELTYDEASDTELDTARATTRREQVKATRTPETPLPASERTTADESKDSKVLKLKDDAPATTSDRKLRSADSPRPDGKKPDDKDNDVIEIIDLEAEGTGRKPDTNFSKSRVKVSPYRRSLRIDDASMCANYTGNNSTMEMDITECSILEQPTIDAGESDSSYLSGLRTVRGRRSYKQLAELKLSHPVKAGLRASRAIAEQTGRPTAPVVGRKRKPDGDDVIDTERHTHAHTHTPAADEAAGASKRRRLFNRLAMPFRRGAPAQIVGINTDLPLSAPVANADSFDPETLKNTTPSPAADLPTAEEHKRCVIM